MRNWNETCLASALATMDITNHEEGVVARRVLCIDDDPSIIRSVRRSLGGICIEVVAASSGEQAIELLQRPGSDFDLVMLDLQMPGIGGMATLDRIRAVRGELRVVMMSGSQADWRAVALERGAVATLDKPFSREAVLSVLRGNPPDAGDANRPQVR